MKKSGRITYVFALWMVFIMTGCQAARESNRDVTFDMKFYMGRLAGVVNVPIDDFYRASKAALQDLDVDIKIQEQDGLAGQILACDSESDNIVIDMEALPGSSTSFSIRVGWSDENKTQIVFNKLKEHL